MLEENQNFPNAWQAFLLIIALFIAEILAGLLLHAAAASLAIDVAAQSALASVLGSGLVFVWLLHFKKLSYAQLFHPSSASIRATLFLLLPPILLVVPALILGLSVSLDWVESIFPLSDQEKALFESMQPNSAAAIVATCLLAPVLEEMMFRGIIMRSFLHQYGRAQAIWGSALLFGFAHLNMYQFIVGVVLGATLAWLYERTRSLWPCITLHCAYNSGLAVLSLIEPESVNSDPPWLSAPLVWLAVVLMAWAGIHALRRLLLPKPV